MFFANILSLSFCELFPLGCDGNQCKFFFRNETSFPNDKGHDFDFMYRLLEDHACGGDMPIRRSLMEHKLQLSSRFLLLFAFFY